MAGDAIQVDGLRELVSALRRFDAELAADLKATNRRLADRLTPVAKAKAPRGATGRLEASVRAGATQRSGVVRAGKSRVPYAGPVHFGWPSRGIRPQPFLWEALDSRRAEIEAEYVERITKLAEQVR